MRTIYVFSARSSIVKMPVIAELCWRSSDGRHAISHTSQHYDRMRSQIFLEERLVTVRGRTSTLLGLEPTRIDNILPALATPCHG